MLKHGQQTGDKPASRFGSYEKVYRLLTELTGFLEEKIFFSCLVNLG